MKTKRIISLAVLGLAGILGGPMAPPARAGAALLVTDADLSSVIWYDGTTGAFVRRFVTIGSGNLSSPTGISFGPDGNLYVASYDSNNVKRYNGRTGAFMGNFASGGGLVSPINLVFGPDGNLYVSGWDSDNLVRYNGTNGAFMDVFIPTGRGGLSQVAGVVFAPGDNLYVASDNSGTGNVLCFDAITGAFKKILIPANSAGLVGPGAMTLGPDGNLYILDYFGNKVMRYNETNGCSVLIPYGPTQPGAVAYPTGVAFGPDGNLYVACYAMGCVKRYNGVTGAFIDKFASGGGLSGPWRITFLLPPTLAAECDLGAGTLHLCWTGCMHRLQAQTNSSGTGLTTNWFDYPGGTNSPVTVPVESRRQSVFYRLLWP